MLAKILLANPRGFCAGVERAIDTVRLALEAFGSPIYVRHEVVHNRQVVLDLQREGVQFIQALEEVPAGAHVVFSAHGVAPAIYQQAKNLGLHIIDATCPLVTKVHVEVVRAAQKKKEVIVIGHRDHVEVIGTVGYYPDQNSIYVVESEKDAHQLQVRHPNQLFYVTQTTLAVGETESILAVLKKRFPKLQGPTKSDICYATTNRQQAVKTMLNDIDALLVIGSDNSSNSKRLYEMGVLADKPSFLIDCVRDIPWALLSQVRILGVTAGASAPEQSVQMIVQRMIEQWPSIEVVSLDGGKEKVHFQTPLTLRKQQKHSVKKGIVDVSFGT